MVKGLTPMKMLKITRCTDPMMWYAKLIGSIVPLVKDYGDGIYLSREPAGYINIVKKEDVEIVEVPYEGDSND